VQDKGQRFIDIFTLLMGVLLGTFVGTVFLLRMMFVDYGAAMEYSNPEIQAAVAERLAPVGEVVLLGDAALNVPPPAPAPARVATTLSGPQVYNEACYLCHAAPGIGGAPVIGDQAAWADRVGQGIDTLAQHAIEGYQGGTGVMPAKGGRLDLSDDEVRAGVQFMLDELTAE